MNTDVLIVGAGPTGLMLAAELGLAGVDALIVDRLAERGDLARAGGINSRTMEIFDQRGLLEPLLAGGEHQRNAGNFAGLQIDSALIDERLSGRFVPQWLVEHVLEDRLGALGIQVRRQHELLAVTSDPDGVTATIEEHGRRRTVRAGYLVAADGAHSSVRGLLGIDFPGTPGLHTTIVADVRLPDHAFEDAGAQWRWADDGDWATLIPYGGRFRFGLGGPNQPHDRTVPISEAEVRAGLSRMFDVEAVEVGYRFRITDTARQVLDYRHGRVFLAGDAAHVHLPLGGQGMNTGIGDAFDLGWKLAAAVQGWAATDLLDTYHRERHPAGARVLFNVAAQKSLMGWTDPVAPRELRDLFAELMRLPGVANHLAELVSGQSVRYPMPGAPDHPLLGRAAPDMRTPTPVGRLYRQLRSGRGLLLAATPEISDLAAAWSDRIDIVSAPLPHSLLIRPDGYVAWAAATPDSARPSLERWFGVPARIVTRA